MKKTMVFVLMAILFSCQTAKVDNHFNQAAIHQLLDQWHIDVATFNYDAYFGKMTKDAIFVGTDSAKKEFQIFCKPYFDTKKTWNFTPLSRNVYKIKNNIAWFDETLDTWMGVCRGSGVLIYKENQWKIQHYVLSVTVPNEKIKEVIALKKAQDILFINEVKKIKK